MADEIRRSAPKDRMVRLLGHRDDASAWQIRDFLKRSVVEFAWIELSTEEDCRRELGLADLTSIDLPVVELPDGARLFGPTLRDVADRLGLVAKPRLQQYDVSIYGAGPAGLSAAVYAASEGLSTVLIERSAVGGQAGTTSMIENYMGFPQGINGADLAERARQQAVKFGVEILMMREGVKSTFRNDRIWTDLADGGTMTARANICATGVEWRRLNLPGEDKLIGRGLYYGAGASEAPLCGGEDVYVVGGGNSAGQAVMHLAKHAKSVTMLVRDQALAGSMSQYLSERILGAANVQLRYDAEITGLEGEQVLERIEIGSRTTKEADWEETRRLFVAIGGVPNTDWTADTAIIRDPGGYLVTGPDLLTDGKPPAYWPLERAPYYLETAVPGSFAAGDVRHRSIKRVATARVKARWPSPSFTDTWRKRHDAVHEHPCLWLWLVVEDSLMSVDAQADTLDADFPTRRILAIVGDKWTTVVLYCLSTREHRRFNELQRQIPDISKKMLIQTLRNLERDGLLERTVHQQVPPKTEYRLTDSGHKLREPIAWLCEWGMDNREFIDGIIEARARTVHKG